MLKDRLSQYSDYAPVIVRLVLGVIFFAHGISKLGNLQGTAQMFGMMGMAAPAAMGALVGILEAVGGAALILGIGTRVAAALLSVVMLVAIVQVKVRLGLLAPVGSPMPGAELDLALLAGLITLILQGAGEVSVDQLVAGRVRA